ncbi:MAG: hypothetical protein H0V17_33345 [Deltaproteobacteria bacterium]|nr:hypothetical protein [Deltaproteobacteria bacterium]
MSVRSFFASLVVVFLMIGGSAAADSKKIEKEKANPLFSGRIMLSDKYYPRSAKSLAAFNAQVRKQSKENFLEDKEKKNWKIYFAGFLKTPLNDVEYLVKIYEMTGRGQQLVATVEQFTDSRGQYSLISSIVLDRKLAGVNKQLLMVLEAKGKTLASARFKILGEGERYSGKVNFSEEDANGGSKDEE